MKILGQPCKNMMTNLPDPLPFIGNKTQDSYIGKAGSLDGAFRPSVQGK
jgi:hypothetical protein